jgi:hypothetical protein
MTITQCPNSHKVEADDAFCPTCGAPCGTPESDAADETATQSNPDATEQAYACSSGHPVAAGQQFCGECGERIVSRPYLHAPPLPSARSSRRGRFGTAVGASRSWISRRSLKTRLALAFGLVAVIVLAIVIPVVAGGSSNNSNVSFDPQSSDTTPVTESATQQCEDALSPWAQYISNGSEQNLTAWEAAVGAQSPVFQIPLQDMEKFQSEVYSVGRSQASQDAYNVLDDDCSTFTANNPNFNWSSVPAAPNS